jgi:SAM-dependent methyltransferase
MPDPEDSSTRSWDSIADDWAAHADKNDYRNILLLPLMLELLGEVRGRRVLDLGCGEGGYSRALAARGAEVTAVDGSERLVEIARRRAAEGNCTIECLCANASSLAPLAPSSFDDVVAAMSLMDVEDYDGAIAEVARVLVAGGRLLMSITHPCFTAPVSEWVRGPKRELRHFAVDRYLDRAAWESEITPSFSRPVVRRHRPLEDYFAPLLRLGFVLRDFREPGVTEEQIRQSPRIAKINRIPYFLFLSWQHAGGA